MKTRLTLVMSVGQSNAYGEGGDPRLATKIVPMTAFDMGYNGDTGEENKNNTPIPLKGEDGSGVAVSGVRQAFARRWYELFGEKILFINAADPGVPIAMWQEDGETYKAAKREYLRVKKLIASSDEFEIVRNIYYFNHGSSDIGENYNKKYYEMVSNTVRLLREECDMTLGIIAEYFAKSIENSEYVREAQRRIAAENDDIIYASGMIRKIEKDKTLIHDDMLHLTQKGHNIWGEEIANAAK